MARFPLADQFLEAHRRISLGDRELVAIAAHVEVRAEIGNDRVLAALGLSDVLVMSRA